MPLYDLACDACLILYEDVACSIASKDHQVCAECAGLLRTSIAPVLTVGVMPSKPRKVGKETYYTNAELRTAISEAEAMGFKYIDKTDTMYKNQMDRFDARRDRTAKAQGYRDEPHRQSVWRKQRMEGKEVGVL